MADVQADTANARPTIEARMGLKTLSPTWAKAEIVLGLSCVWAAMHPTFLLRLAEQPATATIWSFWLFLLGAYLAMAGSRSHIYQSANRVAEFLSRQIDRKT